MNISVCIKFSVEFSETIQIFPRYSFQLIAYYLISVWVCFSLISNKSEYVIVKFQNLQEIFTNSGTKIKFNLRCVTLGFEPDIDDGKKQAHDYNDKNKGIPVSDLA